MNVYKSSFLIIGKGETYKSCKKFFDDNSISYKAIITDDALNVKDMKIIIKPEHQQKIRKRRNDER